jgi:hypothetical protein
VPGEGRHQLSRKASVITSARVVGDGEFRKMCIEAHRIVLSANVRRNIVIIAWLIT